MSAARGGGGGWNHGYFADGRYANYFHRELVPGWLDLAALIRGHAPPRRREGTPFRYLDLGTGMGYGLCLIAAAHPEGKFVGVDFLPDHIAHGRWLAAELGLENVRFLEADFLSLRHDPSPLAAADGSAAPFAYVVAHGIATWVSAEVRQALLAVASTQLEHGGIFYCSYNTHPGWLSRTPLQALLQLEHQRADPSDPRRSIEHSAARLAALLGNDDDPGVLARALPTLAADLQRIRTNPDLAYMCGEYLSVLWQPLYVGEMHGLCAACKLSHLGSATLPELFEVFLPERVRPVVSGETNPLIREALLDLAINQSFRRDLFVKGRLGLTAPLRQQALAAVRLRRLQAAGGPHKDYVFVTSCGEFHADPGLCRAVEDLLAEGPCDLGQLGQALAMDAEALLPGLSILLHADRLALDRGEAAAAASAPARRANEVLLRLIAQHGSYSHLVTPASGGALSVSFLDGLVLEASAQGVEQADLPACVELGIQLAGAQLRDERQQLLEDPALRHQKLVELVAELSRWRFSLLQDLGALG
jgi:SAM-dependent methyltransferase